MPITYSLGDLDADYLLVVLIAFVQWLERLLLRHGGLLIFERNRQRLGKPLVKLGVAKYLSTGVSLLAITLLVENRELHALADRPLQTIVLGLPLVGLALLVVHLTCHSFLSDDAVNVDRALLVQDIHEERKERSSSIYGQDHFDSSLYRWASLVVTILICFVLRLRAFVFLLQNSQCTLPGIESLLPFVLSLWECYPSKAWSSMSHPDSPINQTSPGSPFRPRPLQPLYLFAGAALTLANALASCLVYFPRSTYICLTASNTSGLAISIQIGCVVLDISILVLFKGLLAYSRSHCRYQYQNPLASTALVSISSAVLVLISGLITKAIPHLQTFLDDLGWEWFRSLCWASLLITIVLIFSMRLVIKSGVFSLAMILSTILVCSNTYHGAQNRLTAVPPGSYFSAGLPILFLIIAYTVQGMNYNTSHFSSKWTFWRPAKVVIPCIVLSLLCLTFLQRLSAKHTLKIFTQHPIDDLIETAMWQHDTWLKQASRSLNLSQAVEEYRRRYNRDPPPGFDLWYKFATERSSLVIDDYDTIHENLLPFWGLSPQELRSRTDQVTADEWNEISLVGVRSGVVSISKVLPTHRWMMEGVAKMMAPFLTLLPDMDIAFNINDESRVAVPYNKLRAYGKRSAQSNSNLGELKIGSWSHNRAASLNNTSNSAIPHAIFKDYSFKKNFQRYGSVACRPHSCARRGYPRDRGTLCSSCFALHSSSEFLADWKLSASPCHQPDLASLHGFYLSPSAFKTTHHLVPIFSQSKAHGYADILYPSAWNYNDKVKYDPSAEHPDQNFQAKSNSLFWRGTTTEAFSGTGTWKGMVRQRLVHTANNSTRKMPVLLPSFDGRDGYSHQEILGRDLPKHPSLQQANFSLSLGFVSMARCSNGDCEEQEAEFGRSAESNFQDHWRHRFLMDVDGAGFSGRFIPFLQSHSLPFKAALFREWYDNRLTAWRHFVPIDIRLHGLWSTVAYFAGGFGSSGNHHAWSTRDPGEMIAESGQDWSSKVLRKEDMEIYFFRLLLEWGRLTDDRRDELGFQTEDPR